MAAFRSWAEVRGSVHRLPQIPANEAIHRDQMAFVLAARPPRKKKGPGRCRGLEFIGGEIAISTSQLAALITVAMLAGMEGATEAQGYLHSDTEFFLPACCPSATSSGTKLPATEKSRNESGAQSTHARNAGECTCSGRTPSATNRAVMPCSQGIALTMRKSKGTRSG